MINSNKEKYINDKWEERYTSALTLITIGLILLLNTSGTLSWSVWFEFIKFWPVFLISAGIQLILSFNTFGKFIGNIIGYLIFVLLMFFAAVNTGSPAFQGFSTWVPKYNFLPFNFITGNSDYSTSTTQEILKSEFTDISETEINIETGYGYFEIVPMFSDNTYLTINSLSNDDTPLTLNKEFVESKLVIDVTTDYKNRLFFNDPKYYLSISKDLPNIDFSYKLGAGKADIDLSNNIDIKSGKIEVGAGEAIMKLGYDIFPESLELNIGAGEMVLNIPTNIGVEIEYNVGVGSINIDGNEFKGGLGNRGEYKSDNWDETMNRISIKAEVGVGSLVVNFE